VGVNPPYSDMSSWTEKVIQEIDNTDTILYLCKGDSSTQWWHLAAQACSYICAIEGRLSFGDSGDAAPFASHVIVFGDANSSLLNELKNHGKVMEVK